MDRRFDHPWSSATLVRAAFFSAITRVVFFFLPLGRPSRGWGQDRAPLSFFFFGRVNPRRVPGFIRPADSLARGFPRIFSLFEFVFNSHSPSPPHATTNGDFFAPWHRLFFAPGGVMVPRLPKPADLLPFNDFNRGSASQGGQTNLHKPPLFGSPPPSLLFLSPLRLSRPGRFYGSNELSFISRRSPHVRTFSAISHSQETPAFKAPLA